MKATTYLLAILFCILLSISCFAVKGEILYYKSGCDYFIVETDSGDYAVLEWFGGHDPDEGDTITGNFNSYGFKDIYDMTVDEEIRVYVEDYLLTKDRAFEIYYEHRN
jgi:hypothetical protein